MRKTYIFLIVTGLVLFVSAGLLFVNYLLNIERIPAGMLEWAVVDSTAHDTREKPMVRIGVISRYAPYLLYEGYQPVMDYLTENSGYTYSLRLSSSYQDAVNKLRDGEVAASFFGTKIYLDAAQSMDIKPVLAPLSNDGTPFIHAVVIVRSTSEYHSLADLKKYTLALPSRYSYSAQWWTTHLGGNQQKPQTVQYFAHHQTVIYKVLKGEYDVGVVKNRVAEEFREKGIRVIAESPSYPSAPLVVLRDSDNPAVESMRDLLLKLDPERPEDSEILSTWDPEFANGFTAVTSELYRGLDYDVRSSSAEVQP